MIKTNATIRRIKPDDLEEVEDIESLVWSEPWRRKLLVDSLKRSRGIAAFIPDVGIVGFAIVRPTPQAVLILRMAVHPSGFREGIGSQLLQAIKSDCEIAGRECAEITVHERNVSGQQFLKANGFRFQETIRKEGWQCDEYLMRWYVGGYVDQSRHRGDCEESLVDVAGMWPASGF